MFPLFGLLLVFLGTTLAIPVDNGCGRFFSGPGLALCSSTVNTLDTQIAKCTGGIKTAYDTSCFQQLQVGDFVTKWAESTPQCDGSGSDGCCLTNEPWSTCFLRLNLDADFDCTKINVGSCSLDGHHGNTSSDPFVAAQVRYVVRNIYSINNFFENWYIATSFATSQAALAVPSIISYFDPVPEAETSLAGILTALTLGLAVLTLPGVGEAVSAVAGFAGELLVAALQQAPTVVSAIWPESESASDQIVHIGELQAELGNLNGQIEHMLSAGLGQIMNDTTAFVGFASSGGFSGPSLVDLPQEVDHLTLAFETYILTAAMRSTAWTAYTGPELPVQDGSASSNASRQNQETFFKCQINGNGVCMPTGHFSLFDVEWGMPSETTTSSGRSYNILQTHSHTYGSNDPYGYDVPNHIVTSGWSTLDLVLDGGWNCTQSSGGNGPAPPSVKLDSAGQGLQFQCLSQLPITAGCDADYHYLEAGMAAGLQEIQRAKSKCKDFGRSL